MSLSAGAIPKPQAAKKRSGSLKRDLFAVEYLKDFNATQAAVRAGYSRRTAASQGQRLLKSALVGEAIAEAGARLLKKTEVSRERILKELATVAFSNIGDFFEENWRLLPIHQVPENSRRALASLKREELCGCDRYPWPHVGRRYKLRFVDKVTALKLLAKVLKATGPFYMTPSTPPAPRVIAKPRPSAGKKMRGSFRRERFVVEYVQDFSATRAALRAGYSPKTAACRIISALIDPAHRVIAGCTP